MYLQALCSSLLGADADTLPYYSVSPGGVLPSSQMLLFIIERDMNPSQRLYSEEHSPAYRYFPSLRLS